MRDPTTFIDSRVHRLDRVQARLPSPVAVHLLWCPAVRLAAMVVCQRGSLHPARRSPHGRDVVSPRATRPPCILLVAAVPHSTRFRRRRARDPGRPAAKSQLPRARHVNGLRPRRHGVSAAHRCASAGRRGRVALLQRSWLPGVGNGRHHDPPGVRHGPWIHLDADHYCGHGDSPGRGRTGSTGGLVPGADRDAVRCRAVGADVSAVRNGKFAHAAGSLPGYVRAARRRQNRLRLRHLLFLPLGAGCGSRVHGGYPPVRHLGGRLDSRPEEAGVEGRAGE